MSEQFKWIGFYTEFASKLLDYKNDRKELIRKLQNVYSAAGIKLPKLEREDVPIDMDPFTVFGLFNKQITEANRISILGGIKSEFDINAPVPDNFDGIPVLNNLKAAFYCYEGDRDEHDIDNLWAVFETALLFSASDTEAARQAFSSAYDKVINQKGVRWNITMALYWIRPYDFINLDSRSRWFLRNPAHITANAAADVAAMKAVPTAEKYLDVRDTCAAALQTGDYEYKTFPELSYTAWKVSEEDNQREKEEARSGKSNSAFLRWFGPVLTALRDLGGSATPADTRKRIVENEQLTEEEITATRGRNNVNKFKNEVAFARLYLVKGGYIDNSATGIWTLTEKGRTADMTDALAAKVFKSVVSGMATRRNEKNALGDADVETVRYWLYAPGEGASLWEDFYKNGIMGLGWHELGDLNAYASKEEMTEKMREVYGGKSSYKNSVHGVWQFVHEMKPGDIIFAKKGRTEILGRGIVESDYEYDEDHEGEYPNIRHVKWTQKGGWQSKEMFAMKTLTDVTNYPDFVAKINALFEDEVEDEEEDETVVKYPPYTMEYNGPQDPDHGFQKHREHGIIRKT